MIPVLVGDEDKISVRHFVVIGQLSERIDVDHLAAETQHESSVAYKGDLQIP